jgi:hypothetical protein
MVEVQVAQQHADRSTLRSSRIAGVYCSIFQNARFQPAPDQIDRARITDSVLDKPEYPFVIEAPKEVLQIRLQPPPDDAAKKTSLRVARARWAPSPGLPPNEQSRKSYS